MLVDAGVWIASASSSEPQSQAARALLREPNNKVAALDLTLYEVANTLTGKFGQPRAAETLTDAIISRCYDGRFVRVDDGILRGAVEIAREFEISVYDAAYVSAARARGWRLISLDVRDLVSKGLAVTPDAALYP
ncbi:MAG TPA: type II toxin-antitoxin system VapC family toxin [Solirubrobacterales bacterium]|nr:type II toxin-antitoxin system VapC family toxin [Solirubrobacterales bacterium]